MEWCGHAGKLPAEAPTDEENDEVSWILEFEKKKFLK